MVDQHKKSVDKSPEKDGKPQGFESLQSQLDAFMAQEKAALNHSGKENDADELQERLDQFIDHLQSQLDVFMESGPNQEKTKAPLASPVVKQSTVQDMPASSDQTATKAAAVKPVRFSSENSHSYSGLISKVLIGAACLTAALLWFVWPSGGPVSPPELLEQQQITDLQSPLLSTPEPAATTATIEDEAVEMVDASMPARPEDKLSEPAVPVTGPESLSVVANIGNIRNGPETSARVLYRLKKGAIVTKLSEQGDWYQVRLRNGTIAWAHKSVF